MTDIQIIKGFWYWDSLNGWPPEAITHFEKYLPSSKLNLNITQLNLGVSEQKKIVKKWCAELPNLIDVRYLWFCSRVNQEMFEAACQVKNLEGLYIKWSGIKNINSLTKLHNLKHLHIGSSGQVESIESLKQMEGLITLNLEQLNKISDFSVIGNLTNLLGLGIDGSMWTSQKIDTLVPIANLTKLKYLTLTNTRLQDKTFDPLLSLNELMRFNSSWNYPESEFDKLKRLPKLKYGNIETSWKELKSSIKF